MPRLLLYSICHLCRSLRRFLLALAVLMPLMIVLIATGAPRWMRIAGIIAGAIVWFRWNWRYAGLKERTRDAYNEAARRRRR